MKFNSLYQAYHAAKDAGKRLPEAEDFLLNQEDPVWWCLAYAREIVRDRWPEAEDILRQVPQRWEDYLYFLKWQYPPSKISPPIWQWLEEGLNENLVEILNHLVMTRDMHPSSRPNKQNSEFELHA
jgi:hypothetical protein